MILVYFGATSGLLLNLEGETTCEISSSLTGGCTFLGEIGVLSYFLASLGRSLFNC